MNRCLGMLLAIIGIALVLPVTLANASVSILDGDSGKKVDEIRRGGCRIAGKKNERFFFLYAKSVAHKFRLTAFIDPPVFEGVHKRYDAYYGGDDPQIFLTRMADDEAFSNFKLPGTPAGTLYAGGIAFRKDGRRVGIALYGASNKSASEGYSFAGVMNCKYRQRRR